LGRTSEQDFLWGVLAINTHKSIYHSGEKAQIMMAVLDERGFMVCDAQLNLTIKSPAGETITTTTSDGSIEVNPQCSLRSYTPIPDYYTEVKLAHSQGVYKMTLSATTKKGTYTISDAFEVNDSVAFDVSREAPTRIFPPVPYPVKIHITAARDFTGTITETVPHDFVVSP
jgi:hypothetical protein